MKKCIYLLALLTLVTLASCNDNDDVSKQSYNLTFDNRAVENNDVVFSQNKGSVEFNNTENTIQISSEFKDIDGRTCKLNTPEMKMSVATSNVCSFTANTISGSTDITGLKGYVDLATGMIWCTFQVNGSTTVYSTAPYLIFPYSTTVIADENDRSYTNEKSAYLFAFDSRGKTCVMQISDFVTTTSGSIAATVIEYNGINATPTTTGYTLTADELKTNASDYYTITDLNIVVDRQGQHMSGTFKCNNCNFTINGDALVITSTL